jgi:hypothetical protein
VFCTTDDRDWYVISSSKGPYVVHEQNYISYRYFYGYKITKYAIRVERLVLHAPEFLVHRTMSCISHTASNYHCFPTCRKRLQWQQQRWPSSSNQHADKLSSLPSLRTPLPLHSMSRRHNNSKLLFI